MATHFLSASSHLHTSSKLSFKTHSPFLHRPRIHYSEEQSCILSDKCKMNARSSIACAVNMTAGQMDDPQKINLETLINKAKGIWESSPQPVKSFPWNRAFENFIQLILDLILAVVKYISVPLFAVSSLSELSYCAHQKKLNLVPFPLVIGFVLAGVFTETALSLSPLLKDAEVPWHLIAIAIFFTLVKLPGPYYPYWGRILLPHLANGGFLRTLWFSIMWFRKPRKGSRVPDRR